MVSVPRIHSFWLLEKQNWGQKITPVHRNKLLLGINFELLLLNNQSHDTLFYISHIPWYGPSVDMKDEI